MIVVDTSALVAICLHEPERDRLIESLEASERVLISAGTLIEARMVAHARGRAPLVDQLNELLAALEIEVVPPDLDQANIAHAAFVAYGKGRHPAALNFGDLFGYALAKARGVPLLYKGEDFARTDIAAA